MKRTTNPFKSRPNIETSLFRFLSSIPAILNPMPTTQIKTVVIMLSPRINLRSSEELAMPIKISSPTASIKDMEKDAIPKRECLKSFLSF